MTFFKYTPNKVWELPLGKPRRTRPGNHSDCRKPQPLRPNKSEANTTYTELPCDTPYHSHPGSHLDSHKPAPHPGKLELYTQGMGWLSGMLPHIHLGNHPDCRKPQPIHPDKTELYT
jgi:hypothetical protein